MKVKIWIFFCFDQIVILFSFIESNILQLYHYKPRLRKVYFQAQEPKLITVIVGTYLHSTYGNFICNNWKLNPLNYKLIT